MNKNILMLLCLIAAAPCFAQVELGLKGTTNFCRVSGLDPNYTGRVGISLGAVSKLNLSKKFILQPELLYAVKGFHFPKTNFNGSGNVALGYLSLPVLAGLKATNKLTILAGPEVNYMLNATSRFDGRSSSIISNYSRFEMGAAVDASYIEKKGIGIELRYSYGISKLTKTIVYTDPSGNVIDRRRLGHNHAVQLGLVYMFKHRNK